MSNSTTIRSVKLFTTVTEMFKIYRVEATYKKEYQSNNVIGCGSACRTAEDAEAQKERYLQDCKIEEVTVREERYGC